MIIPKTHLSETHAVGATASQIPMTLSKAVRYIFACTVACWIRQRDPGARLAKASQDFGAIGSGAFDTILQAKRRGATGNNITVELIGDSAAAGGVTLEETGDTLIIHYETEVSTVTHVQTALAASTLVEVKTTGTGATILDAATDDVDATALEGGEAEDGTDPVATAADGSMYVPAATQVILDGRNGTKVSVIRASGDGVASLTPGA